MKINHINSVNYSGTDTLHFRTIYYTNRISEFDESYHFSGKLRYKGFWLGLSEIGFHIEIKSNYGY